MKDNKRKGDKLYVACNQQVSRFVRDESGVYSIIMGLITVFLLIAISFTFEFSGMLMDKARLSDGLEQAALSVIAENNKDRARDGLNEGQARDRNHLIADNYATLYLPGHNQPNLKVVCDKNYTGNSKNSGFLQESAEADITCAITGTVNRHTWLPINLGDVDVVPTQTKIGSYGLASKSVTEPIPFDIVLAVEMSDAYSTSVGHESFKDCYAVPANMRNNLQKYRDWRARRCSQPTGAQFLGQVVNQFTSEQFFNGDNAVTRNSRIAFFPFNFGGQLLDRRETCILPVVGKSDADVKNYTKAIDPNGPDAYYEWTAKKQYGFFGAWFRFYINEPLHIFQNRASMAASIQGALQKFHIGLNEPDSEHVYFFTKYLPYYIDYAKTVSAVRNMQKVTGDELSNRNNTEKRMYTDLNSLICFQGVPSNNYQMSSGWYNKDNHKTFGSFINERLQYSGGASNLSTAMLAATQHFVNLGANPKNKATQRLLIIVGSGQEFSMGNTYILEQKDWLCSDRDPRTGETTNILTKCQDHKDRKRIDWVKKHSRYYGDNGNRVRIPNITSNGIRNTFYQFNRIGDKLFEAGACDAIRERLDAMDTGGISGNRSKVIFINYLKRMTPEAEGRMRRCVDEFYQADTRQELLDALSKSLQRENVAEEEVGKNRVLK